MTIAWALERSAHNSTRFLFTIKQLFSVGSA